MCFYALYEACDIRHSDAAIVESRSEPSLDSRSLCICHYHNEHARIIYSFFNFN